MRTRIRRTLARTRTRPLWPERMPKASYPAPCSRVGSLALTLPPYIYMCIYICTCMYIYVYTRTHTHTHTHTHFPTCTAATHTRQDPRTATQTRTCAQTCTCMPTRSVTRMQTLRLTHARARTHTAHSLNCSFSQLFGHSLTHSRARARTHTYVRTIACLAACRITREQAHPSSLQARPSPPALPRVPAWHSRQRTRSL